MPKQTILVVDDEPKMRRLLEIMLTQMEYCVLQAADGREAFDILSECTADLVITDLRMPNLDGIALLRQLRENNNDIPVIVVTAYGTVESAVDAMKYGASDYIVRPFELDAVEAAVQRALRLGKVQRENRYLRQQVEQGWHGFIGTSPVMQQIYTQIQQVAATKTSVLIQGETGTGKELVARAIHNASNRAKSLFVSINCAAIPADILESELFGYSKGAFTGANKERIGKFELADGGTLFLDEITEMDFNLQAKLLRVLQERTLERLGSNRTIAVDVRVIAASNRNPRQAIVDQKLREDLFYRLNVFTISLPRLRERREDILPLAHYFLEKHARDFGFGCNGIEADAEACLIAYQWPGNVRELENMMERAIVMSSGKTIGIGHLPSDVLYDALPTQAPLPDQLETGCGTGMIQQVEQLEKQLIQQALIKTGDNKAKAAQLLEISERSLWYKIKKYF
ncbi:MAG: sigma-54 dependent transcriptional regulator [Methylovulum sp.]|uniref:sigma-54-dependent transcriptional regulator n=1 Tax=Methylovulum sp. TaxID=1916980 RepID=UPI0026233919|nr:sigma-54 dependent transcriptional regulator [Methylovulum sp.]MDD2722538.1 sigma-54 dependent transcriptional regulator [Methylovulum sp.]MDD5123066.1 sigma-54 dependent transcriptional regulator [Methylovulum sp.]